MAHHDREVGVRRCEDHVTVRCLAQMRDHDLTQAGFQRLGRQAPAGRVGASRDQAVRDIVGKTPTMALAVGRGQEITRLIPKFAGEDPGLGGGLAPPARSRTGGDEPGLHVLPERLLDDRRMLPWIGLVLVPDPADVDRVGQEVMHLPAGEGRAAPDTSGAGDESLWPQPPTLRLVFDQPQIAKFGIEAEKRSHHLGFNQIDHQFPPLRIGVTVIAEGHGTSHPEALRLRGSDLVADALGGDLAFELCEGQQNVQRQPPHGRGSIEGLCHRDEGTALGIKPLDQTSEVDEGAGQPVDLVDNHHADPPGFDLDKKPLQGRAVERPAGEPPVIEAVRHQLPAFVPLAGEVGGTGFMLCIERGEGLIQALLAGLARIDRTADHRFLGHAARSLRDWRLPALPAATASAMPKKRGPDQRAPVMARAMADSGRCRVPFQR